MAIYTQAGEEVVVAAIAAGTSMFGGWGTGTQTPAKANTALNAETGTRVAATESHTTPDINQWVYTLTAGAALAITETGLFDAATAGNLVIYDTFAAINLSAGWKIEFTVTLEQT